MSRVKTSEFVLDIFRLKDSIENECDNLETAISPIISRKQTSKALYKIETLISDMRIKYNLSEK